MIVAIAPLHREYGLRELVLASYQAVSGAGQIGVDTLHDQLAKIAGDRALGSRSGNVRQAVGDDLGPFPAPLALNVVPWAGSLKDGGWSSEELKLRNESRKILGLPDLKVSATCVRVPRGDRPLGGRARGLRRRGARPRAPARRCATRPGVILVDDPAAGEFPMPIDAVGTDPSWVGRIRRAMDDPARARPVRHRRQPAQGRGRSTPPRSPNWSPRNSPAKLEPADRALATPRAATCRRGASTRRPGQTPDVGRLAELRGSAIRPSWRRTSAATRPPSARPATAAWAAFMAGPIWALPVNARRASADAGHQPRRVPRRTSCLGR